MSALRDAMSHAVLGWVKPELDETLRLARSEVEMFVEEPSDTARMHFCAGYLHQVQGTLRMVELYAPAMVAEELELLAQALQDGAAGDRDEACGTLMRGTVLLPDYLERLQGGHRDIPIVLLPLLNDIRAARGAPGLSESVLFAPDLEQPLPEAVPLPEVLSWQARQSRVDAALKAFDQAIAGWPEDAAPADQAALRAALAQLLESVEHIATRRMLWVASSVAEALREGAISPSPALRQAFQGVGRAVHASHQEGAIGIAAPSQEPTRQLLYLVTQSPARHAALDALRQAFSLDAAVPSEAELDHARGSVSGRNRALLDTVGGAVKEELLRIKDALDLHLRTGAPVDALQAQVGELGNVADTLGMMGLGVARGVVVQQRDALREMVDGARAADEGALLDIAGALLYVDASLDDQVARLGESDGATAAPASSEALRTLEVLAQEAIHNFAAAREGFVAFIETSWNHEQLTEVPRLLSEVSGALRMLELPAPAEYLIAVRQYVAVELIGKRRVPGGQQLDTLADAMASLEYYLEALRESRPNREEILDITRSSLEKLRYWPIPAEADAAAPTPAAVRPAAVQPETPAPVAVEPELEIAQDAAPEIAAGQVDADAPVESIEVAEAGEDAAAGDDVAAPSAQSEELSAVAPAPVAYEWQAPAATPEPEAVAMAPAPTQPEAVEPETVERETVEPEAVEAEAAELTAVEAEAAEPVRIEAEAMAPGASVPALEQQTTDASSAASPAADETQRRAAEEARQAFESLDVPSTLAPAAFAGQGSVEGGFDLADNDIDDDIREVFLEEFDEEIVNLNQMLPQWIAAPNNMERLRSIRRVFHTLKGSGRLVGARLLGEFSWKTENMLNRVLDGSRPPSPAVIAQLQQAAQVLPQLNAALRGQGRIHADLDGLQELADRIGAGEEAFYQAPSGASVGAPKATTGSPAFEAPAAVVRSDADMRKADEAEVPAVFEPDEDGTPASLDGVLREILETEVAAHLETVDAWLLQARAERTLTTETLLRAFHTMNGAFAMADVPEITDVTGAAEQYIKRLWSAAEAPSPEGISAIADSAHAIRRCVAALQSASPRIPVFGALASQLVSLRDTLPDSRPSVVLVDDSAQSTYPGADVAAPTPLGTDEVELAALDLSAFIDMEQTAADADAADVLETASAEAVPTAMESGFGPDSYGRAIPRPPADPTVSFYDLELTYTSSAAPPAEGAGPVDTFDGEDDDVSVSLAAPQAEEITFDDAVAAADAQATDEPASMQDEAADAASGNIDDIGAEAAFDIAAVSADEYAAVQAAEAAGLEQPVDPMPAAEAVQVAQDEASEQPAAIEEALSAQDEAQEEASTIADEAPVDALAEHASEADAFDAAADGSGETPAIEAGSEPAQVEPEDAQYASHEETAAVEEQPETPAAVSAMADDMLDFTELDRDLVDIFVEEGNDLLDHSDGLLALLRETPDDRSLVTGLQRDLHTIKGGARMAGINAIGDLGHAIESLLEQVAAQRVELDRGSVQLLERGFDGLHGLVARVGAHRQVAMPSELIAEFEQRAHPERAAEQPAEVISAAATPARVTPATPTAPLAPLSAPVDPNALAEDEVQPYAAQEQVRVRSDLLDRLVNNAGEVAIYRSRLEQQLGAFRGAMAELDRTNTRLHDQLRRLDLETEAQIVARYQREQDKRDPTFDPLELDRFSTLQQLSRGLAESAADLTGLQGVLDDLARQYDGLLQQQSRVSSELQDGLMRARMVPFDGIVPRLRRVLRQAATDTGKHVRLQLDGAHGELDRNVLERMTAPLEHLLRNAVAHGLEAPKARKKSGKAEEGTVQIALRREGAEMVLQVSDDGAGIDHAAIRRRAEQRGMVQPGAVVGDSDLERLILESGFSTSDSISQLAGRGVGMDVVYSEVRQLGGSLEIASQAKRGTSFTLRLPQTLAVTQAVFVQIGETQFAVPVAAVAGVGRIARDRFESKDAVYVYAGEDYVLHDLGSLTGHAPARAEGQPQVPLLLVRAGDLRAAVAVDQVLGNREIVVKPVGPQIASVPGIYGATITGDGRIVVILDVAPLVRRHILQPQLFHTDAPAQEERAVPLVMVVDDSLTMRKVTGRVLERHNFEVAVARDGVEALEKLEERVPDLMLLDIEMPRMDGYELATAMKADPRFAGVPIVMITSRTGDKHRQRALEIGVQRYMGKPYQELDLMRNVYDLLGIARVRE